MLVRRATRDDLNAIIGLLSDDPISAGRGDIANDEDEPAYAAALDRIIHDPGNELLVAVNRAGAVLGTLQLTVIPGMARRGSTRFARRGGPRREHGAFLGNWERADAVGRRTGRNRT